MKSNFYTYLLSLVCLASCTFNKQDDFTIKSSSIAIIEDPLPSWNKGTTKADIINFITAASQEGSPSFIPVEDRIATFDNDGTLWAEQPAYFQFFFAIDQIKNMAKDHPEWNSKEPYKSILENDFKALMNSGMDGLMKVIMQSHTGLSHEQYFNDVQHWVENARHPKFNRPFTELVYQPMLELLDLLRDHDFKIFIVSGGGVDFMRVWAPEVYRIPSDQIIGSSVKAAFSNTDGKVNIHKLAEINFIDDKEGKPVGIHQYIGKKPVFAVGNSDGDLQMLQYCASNDYHSFQLYLHHTDNEREWAYDRESHVGQLNEGLDEALAKKWTIIDMKSDWKFVFPFEKTP